MDNKIERLEKFDDRKLVDVVKNYKQYGYGEEFKEAAIRILKSRGVDMEVLRLRGELRNHSYDEAKYLFDAFEGQSKAAFVFYILFIVFKILLESISESAETTFILVVLAFLGSIIGFYVSLIKSFISQAKYYKLIGKKESQLNPILFFTVGMGFYAVMYFVFRKQMRDEMNSIR